MRLAAGNALMRLLAAHRGSGGVWGRFDHSRPGIGATEACVIAIATLLLLSLFCLSIWREKRQRAQFQDDSHPRLFRALAAAHQLTRVQRRMLQKIAGANDLADPAALFVEPRYFEMSSGTDSVCREGAQLLQQALFKPL